MDDDKEAEKQPLVDSDASARRVKPKRLVIVEPLLFFYAFTGFPLYSVYNQYFLRKVGYDMGIDYDNLTTDSNDTCSMTRNDTGYLQREAVQAAAAQWKLYLSLATFVPSLVARIAFGALSDRIGRRIAFILPPIGEMFIAALYLCIIHFELPIYYFFLQALEHLFGGKALLLVGACAYLADTTSKKWLAVRLTIVDVVHFFSGGLSELGIGYLIKFSGYAWPLVFVLVGKMLALLYAIFFIPETLPVQKDNTISSPINSENGTSQIRNPSKLKTPRVRLYDFLTAIRLFTHDNGSGRKLKLWLLTASFFANFVFGTKRVQSLYEQNTPFCWDSVLLGYYGTVHTLLPCLGTLAGLGFKKCLHAAWIMAIGRLSGVGEFLMFAVARNTVELFFVPVIGCLTILSDSMMRSIMSGYVRLEEQASLFAALACVSTVSELAGSIMVSNTYKGTLLWFPQLVFVIALVLHVISLIFALYAEVRDNLQTAVRRQRNHDDTGAVRCALQGTCPVHEQDMQEGDKSELADKFAWILRSQRANKRDNIRVVSLQVRDTTDGLTPKQHRSKCH